MKLDLTFNYGNKQSENLKKSRDAYNSGLLLFMIRILIKPLIFLVKL